MRIHIQLPPGDPQFRITPEQWHAAVARGPDLGPLEVSFANDDAGFAAAIPETEVLVTWTKEVQDRFPPGTLPAGAPKLKMIFCTSVGVDRLFPLDWLPDSVMLLNNRGAHETKGGEFALMALLMLAAHMPRIASNARDGQWKPLFSSVLAGRTVCIVGLGTIGGTAARHAASFGMKVIGIRNTPAPHPACAEVHGMAGLDAVLPRAEFLLLVCPLTPQTRGLMDARRLALLPAGAKVVNMARGEVWDQEAACDLLDSGHLDGCITDVAVPEPLPPTSRLWRTPGMLVLPHVSAGDAVYYNDRTLDILLTNLAELQAGRAVPNRVLASRGY